MLFVHITQLSDVAYSQVFKALRFQPVLAETLLPQTVLRQLMTTKMVSISFPQFI